MSKHFNTILFDGPERSQLLPFTYIRPVAELRIGIDTLREKWEAFLGQECSFATQNYLSSKYPLHNADLNYFINPTYIPTRSLAIQVKNLKENQVLIFDSNPVAFCTTNSILPSDTSGFNEIDVEQELTQIKNCSDLFVHNAEVLAQDFKRLTKDRMSQVLGDTNRVINPEQVFVEPGARVSCAILNASEGPIYIGADAQIMEGSMLRGPLAICKNSVVKMGAKIYGGTTIGPNAKVGGELNNVLFLGNSNKGHDGFLGNAVIGEWCNIGAATDASNLKNNYSKIRIWNYVSENFAKTELQFCGLLMGDYSRCGIHSMFNTATVIGVNSNVFGTGFPRTFIPSYSYGGAQGFQTYAFAKAMESNNAMMERKGSKLTDHDIQILETIFDTTAVWRKDS
ncbi:MAG: glucose-1-phosphate thymidylyltransferase [Flavobacteriaceae bacterium]|nr:glucose-1-phosphate thymidylyltransferase [Flavobacteriaceae bacterium]MDO7591662.1 glucose-1-phosphate thymidylyltransferase [Flavobacteriaceae bacterium]MDO7602926.1 glucose-1-phosphate thymidylyltransferase [Flavobacteriaceae bacterium]MDO7615673.1 glucose-1-phosphate thymidylyltransferase [Flavobacteriaceae bacterium]MDO7702901.1 glucose-1-phosphate thymidylyltransferase [Flavobacteriaceae bacterium]